VSALDRERRTIWIADVHHGDGKRFGVQADEILTAFMELEAAILLVRRRPRRRSGPSSYPWRKPTSSGVITFQDVFCFCVLEVGVAEGSP
jgi:hypothetical protein